MKKIIGYAHKDTLKRGAWGWYYPVVCDRKTFLKMLKGLGKQSTKYFREVTVTIKEIK